MPMRTNESLGNVSTVPDETSSRTRRRTGRPRRSGCRGAPSCSGPSPRLPSLPSVTWSIVAAAAMTVVPPEIGGDLEDDCGALDVDRCAAAVLERRVQAARRVTRLDAKIGRGNIGSFTGSLPSFFPLCSRQMVVVQATKRAYIPYRLFIPCWKALLSSHHSPRRASRSCRWWRWFSSL
jgi:hypothetical protein